MEPTYNISHICIHANLNIAKVLNFFAIRYYTLGLAFLK